MIPKLRRLRSAPLAYAHEQPTDVRRQVHERKEAEPRTELSGQKNP